MESSLLKNIFEENKIKSRKIWQLFLQVLICMNIHLTLNFEVRQEKIIYKIKWLDQSEYMHSRVNWICNTIIEKALLLDLHFSRINVEFWKKYLVCGILFIIRNRILFYSPLSFYSLMLAYKNVFKIIFFIYKNMITQKLSLKCLSMT